MVRSLLDRVRFLGTWSIRAVRVPGHERYVALQALRSTLAAVIAWLVVSEWFHFQQGFLAPYVAVFLVEATILRSLQQAAVQLGAVVTGLLVAVVVSRLVESSTAAIGLAVAVGYFLGQWRRFGSSGIWVAITALLVIATGASDSPVLLGERLLETLIGAAVGAAVGVAVTALVFPPVYPVGEETAELTGELRDLLREMARGCREVVPEDRDGWVRRARGIDRLLQRALDESRWAHESVRLNPRPAATRIGDRVRRSDRTVANLSTVPSAVEELAHALGPVVDDELSECDRAQIRTAVAALLDALADVVDTLQESEHADVHDTCRQRLSDLERVATGCSNLAVTAKLGAVLHTAHRIVGAVGLR